MQGGFPRPPLLPCHYCNKPGHPPEHCWRQFPHLRPPPMQKQQYGTMQYNASAPGPVRAPMGGHRAPPPNHPMMRAAASHAYEPQPEWGHGPMRTNAATLTESQVGSFVCTRMQNRAPVPIGYVLQLKAKAIHLVKTSIVVDVEAERARCPLSSAASAHGSATSYGDAYNYNEHT